MPETEAAPDLDKIIPRGGPDWDKFLPKPEAIEAARAGTEKALRDKIDKTDSIFRETEGRVERDRGKAETALDASWASSQQMKPWDTEQKRQEIMTNPIEAFGSFASVFGIMASAFTRAPLENALNASASAMNAIKARDEKQYEQSYTAWKDNNDLVVKRFNMQHAVYGDAIQLMTTDMAAGRAKAEHAAIRFGDEKALVLLQNGMNKEYIDYVNGAASAVKGISEAGTKITEDTFRTQIFRQLQQQLVQQGRGNDPNAQIEVFETAFGTGKPPDNQLFRKFMSTPNEDGSAKTAEQGMKFWTSLREATRHHTADDIILEKYLKENPAATAEDIIALKQRAATTGNAEVQAMRAFTENYILEHNRPPTREEVDEYRKTWKAKDATLGTYKGTEAQNKNLAFATDMDRGIRNIEEVTAGGYRPSKSDLFKFEMIEANLRSKGGSFGTAIGAIPGMLANMGLSDEAQRFYQAAREYTAGVLRRETGAAFNHGELTNTINRFIPQPDDKPDTLKQKEAARNEKRNAVWLGTGLPRDAWSLDSATSVMGGGPAIKTTAAKPASATVIPKEAEALLKEGVVTTFKNGEKWTIRDGKPAKVE